jgi:hypothetical protein
MEMQYYELQGQRQVQERRWTSILLRHLRKACAHGESKGSGSGDLALD